mmetsp:Transcript_3673/g.7332  ORF Transcript_3673/g.7332 Transcript_3673/m.7332 type:complete len:83 (-) Transcript_3673:635-883(-)
MIGIQVGKSSSNSILESLKTATKLFLTEKWCGWVGKWDKKVGWVGGQADSQAHPALDARERSSRSSGLGKRSSCFHEKLFVL